MKKNDKASETNPSRKFQKIQLVSLISFIFALLAILLRAEGKISIESLITRSGGTPIRSAALLVLLFGIKSLTIIVPLASLCIASGILFPPVWALTISFLGLAVTLTVPYLLGRWSGAEEIDYVKAKYPKLDRLIEFQQKNEFFASFIVRMIGWFPCDVLSYYFGACRTKYLTYLLSALLGCAIGVVTNTLLGDVLLKPFSIQFVVLILIKLLISVSAIVIAYFLNRE